MNFLTTDLVTDKIYESLLSYGDSRERGLSVLPPTKQAIKNTLEMLCSQTHRVEVIKDLIKDLESWKDDNYTEGESQEFCRGMDAAIEVLKSDMKICEKRQAESLI